MQNEIRLQATSMELELGVVGLMNVQFAIQNDRIYVLDVNPRASRTVPFVSKATGVPLAKVAAKVIVGKKLAALGLTKEVIPSHMSVKESVFPFIKFIGVYTLLGPEMKSTGEVMGIGDSFGTAFAKAQIAAGTFLCPGEMAFLSVGDEDRERLVPTAKKLVETGFSLLAARGTAKYLANTGVKIGVAKGACESGPNILDILRKGKISMVIATGRNQDDQEGYIIRRAALEQQVPYFTTLAGAEAAAEGIRALRQDMFSCFSLQDYYDPARNTVRMRNIPQISPAD